MVETPAVVEPCAVVDSPEAVDESPGIVDDSPEVVDESPVEGLKDVVAEPEVEEILVVLEDGLEVDCIEDVAIAEVVDMSPFVVVDPPGVVDTPGLEGAGEDSDGVDVLEGPAGNVDEEKSEEVEGEEEDEEEEDEEVAGHSSLSVPVRGPAPMQ